MYSRGYSMPETVIIGVIWAVIVNGPCAVTACMLWTAIYLDSDVILFSVVYEI